MIDNVVIDTLARLQRTEELAGRAEDNAALALGAVAALVRELTGKELTVRRLDLDKSEFVTESVIAQSRIVLQPPREAQPASPSPS